VPFGVAAGLALVSYWLFFQLGPGRSGSTAAASADSASSRLHLPASVFFWTFLSKPTSSLEGPPWP